MLATHYSSNEIVGGSVIRSDQTKERLYRHVHAIYKGVADDLGKYFPDEYGYAYPIWTPRKKFPYVYQVTAEASYVTAGNFNHSLYVAIARVSEFTDKRLPLNQRVANRDGMIRQLAELYFAPGPVEYRELISDRWIVG